VGRKRGCFTSTGRTASGNVVFDDLGISSSLKSQIKTNCYLLDTEKSLLKLKNRKGDAHKGDFGHVLVIGGDKGFGGAAILASKAAVFSGAGLVSLATRSIHVEAALSSCPELMVNGIESGQDVEEILAKSTVVVLGPGLGQSAWSEQMLQRTFMEAKKRNLPVVLDADGLNLLTKLKLKSGIPRKMVITPHPGEAARLVNKEVNKIQEDRFKSVTALEKKFGSVSVLKGSGSLVCYKRSGKQRIGVCEAGNPGMAKGGMGDVLAGLIGSFLSQGLGLVEATEVAVDLHSKSADIASLELGMTITPTDVIRNVRYFLR
jgi:NAD(P)H-hydrate epimerase